MRMKRLVFLCALIITFALGGTTQPVRADEKQELLEIRNTTLNLIEALVEEGLLPRKKADKLIREAEARAEQEAEQARTAAPVATATAAGVAAGTTAAAADPDVVRVSYVPDFVRDEIRDEVRAELREDVLADVRETAKTERWGIPGALPEWTSRFKFYGDVRVRGQADLYGSDNLPNTYLDFNRVNAAGGIIPAGRGAFLNTNRDSYRGRVRARLGMNIKITDNVKAGLRITTGNLRDPVSTNQSLANYEGRYQIGLDRVFLEYDGFTENDFQWLQLQAGRIPNPWLHTNLVWDRDLSFEGAVAKFRADLSSNDSLYAMDSGGQSVFLTAGIFPLQERDQELPDFTNKWLAGGQTGLDWTFDDQSNLKFGVAYYHYENVQGVRNTFNSNAQNSTAPIFVQKGNNMFNILNNNDPDSQLFALASKFEIFNVTARYDYAGFAPVHVIVTGDYAHNFGFNQQEVMNRTGIEFRKRVDAWQARVQVGWPKIRKWLDWNLFFGYKYIERDSVLDAFNDSDFHLGGTDAKGFVLGGNLGLTYNTWLRWRWLSANEIDGPPLAIDVLQMDVNARF